MRVFLRVCAASAVSLINNGRRRIGNDDLGANLRAGVFGIGRHGIGVRGDMRYFHNLVNAADSGDVDFGAFHFWCASLGLVIGF
jgi:hypothetical protein